MTRRLICSAAMLLVAAAAASAQGQRPVKVDLAWDRNQEPEVAGYVVYVGRLPGVFDERHDVGSRTTFTYTRPADGQRYYFAVAAYTPGPVIGPRSAPVSHVAGGVAAAVAPVLAQSAPNVPAPPHVEPLSSNGSAGRPFDRPAGTASTRICSRTAASDCYDAEPLFRTASTVQSLAPAPDGRLFVASDDRHIQLHLPGAADLQHAATLDEAVIGGFAVSPSFEQTGFVYVGRIDSLASGTRELSIVRYREVHGILGEAAVLVTGLRIDAGPSAPFTIGEQDRIYAAIAEDGGRRDPYAGSVVRWTREGAVPFDAPAMSPVLAEGLAAPSSLTVNQEGSRLWLAGLDGRGVVRVLSLDLREASRTWPRRPETAALDDPARRLEAGSTSHRQATFLVTPSHDLVRCVGEQEPFCETLGAIDVSQLPIAAAAGPNGTAYVALRSDDGTTTVVRLRASPGSGR